MTENQITSWIFLATAVASQVEPANFNSIAEIADGINHAIPTDRELQSSLIWLARNGLVTKTGSNYNLTAKGKMEYETISRETSTYLELWDKLDTLLKKYHT